MCFVVSDIVWDAFVLVRGANTILPCALPRFASYLELRLRSRNSVASSSVRMRWRHRHQQHQHPSQMLAFAFLMWTEPWPESRAWPKARNVQTTRWFMAYGTLHMEVAPWHCPLQLKISTGAVGRSKAYWYHDIHISRLSWVCLFMVLFLEMLIRRKWT